MVTKRTPRNGNPTSELGSLSYGISDGATRSIRSAVGQK
jgi:hypothetical protein